MSNLTEYRKQVLTEAIDAAVSKYETEFLSHPEVEIYNRGVTDARLAIVDLMDVNVVAPKWPDTGAVRYHVQRKVLKEWHRRTGSYDQKTATGLLTALRAKQDGLEYRLVKTTNTTEVMDA